MIQTIVIRFSFLFVLLSCAHRFYAQDPRRLQAEVAELIANDKSLNKKDVILFTGSSSIRMWSSLQSDFPNYNIVNRGFGGSQASDLLYFFDQLILPYNPKKIFIYEGDNDLSVGKSPKQIMSTMDSVIAMIRQRVSNTVPVYLISAKPSTSRWHLKEKYVELNKLMNESASKKKNVHFIDVWSPALDKDGVVIKDIFLDDGLHMNSKGYEIWARVLRKHLP